MKSVNQHTRRRHLEFYSTHGQSREICGKGSAQITVDESTRVWN